MEQYEAVVKPFKDIVEKMKTGNEYEVRVTGLYLEKLVNDLTNELNCYYEELKKAKEEYEAVRAKNKELNLENINLMEYIKKGAEKIN